MSHKMYVQSFSFTKFRMLNTGEDSASMLRNVLLRWTRNGSITLSDGLHADSIARIPESHAAGNRPEY